MESSLIRDYLKPFPVMLFAVVMGLSGLVIAYEKANFLFGFPNFIWMGLLVLTVAIFSVVLLSYSLKAATYPNEVAIEAKHPIKSNFLATIPISFLLISIVFFNEVNPFLSFAFWWIGVIGQLASILYSFPRWINHSFQIEHLNPAWFIPIVGAILVPIVGVDVAPMFVSIFFFSIGMFFWIIFFSIVMYRLIFHEPPAERFIPTLFILIAPPAVGLISYFRITDVLDMTGYLLYSLALFFALLLLVMAHRFKLKKFYISWWAYTFPLDALTIASMLIYEVTKEPLFAGLSIISLILATIVVSYVGYATIVQTINHKLFDE